ncbi:hypothetical protein EOPP23_20945 [Endozoicomonas sp. OPT23]|nr:hypothetical protein [Endozoicomonas sp. OPT23]
MNEVIPLIIANFVLVAFVFVSIKGLGLIKHLPESHIAYKHQKIGKVLVWIMVTFWGMIFFLNTFQIYTNLVQGA